MLEQYFPNVCQIAGESPTAIIDTLKMIFIPGVIAFLVGLVLAMSVVVSRKDGIKPNRILFNIVDLFINLFRSIPFVILIAVMASPTRLIMGTSIGVKGAYPALILGTIPFFARQIESAFREVDSGLIEASQAMGLSTWDIITRVYLRESVPSLVRAVTITLISLVGLTAIAGAIGAGGLGDMAIRYGYNRYMDDVTLVIVIIILIIVSLIQVIGDLIIKKTTH